MRFQTVATMVFVTVATFGVRLSADENTLHEQLAAAAALIKVEGVGTDNRPTSWTGSGVAVHGGGWVITNRHVAPGNARTANTIRVVFNAGTSEEFSGPADVVLVHPDRDLTLLKCSLDEQPTTLPLGAAAALDLTDTVLSVGLPLGHLVAANNSNPSVSIVTGGVSSLQKDEDGRLRWIDVAASVAGGNSGSALVDERGRVIGIVAKRYESFARAVPVEFVQELLGEAALDISFDLKVAGGDVRVVVKPRGPASKLVLGKVVLVGRDAQEAVLVPADEGQLAGRFSVPANGDDNKPLPIRIRATTDSGFSFERVVGLYRSDQCKTALRGTIHSVTLSRLKSNGWRWDADDPDPFCKLYVNSLLVKQTSAVRNQMRFLEATEFDCNVGDKIRVVVYESTLFILRLVTKTKPFARYVTCERASAGSTEATGR